MDDQNSTSPARLLNRLTQRREYFCDTGVFAGSQYVRLDGYFTLDDYAKLLEYVNYAGEPPCVCRRCVEIATWPAKSILFEADGFNPCDHCPDCHAGTEALTRGQ